MNTAVINIKTDAQVKKQAQKVVEELGLSLSAAINGFLRHLIKTKTVTFSTREEIPSKYLIESIKQAEEDYRKGNTSPVFKTGKEAVKYLEDMGI